MIARENITGLILAGGQGQRMGGADKGLLTYHGKPLIEWAITRLQSQVGSITISANRNLPRYANYGYPVITDETPEFAGPLAGFLAGLKDCRTPYLLTSPCDSPLLPLDLGTRLAERLQETNADLVYASTEEPTGAILSQPVFCLMQSSLAESLHNFLNQGDFKIGRWLKTLRTSTVVFEDIQAFANINTPAEIQALEKIF